MIGITAGAFDLCHTGHILLLKEAKEHCDHLIVALHVNPKLERKDKNKPLETVSERYMKLCAIEYVDSVVPYETEEELKELLLMLRPDIRFVGEDWKVKKGTGMDLVPIYWIKRNHHQSSTNLRKRIK